MPNGTTDYRAVFWTPKACTGAAIKKLIGVVEKGFESLYFVPASVALPQATGPTSRRLRVTRPTLCSTVPAAILDRHVDAAVDEELHRLVVSVPNELVQDARIIGCPHEEGIDYPDGESCPQCPFWRSQDRLTGEMIN